LSPTRKSRFFSVIPIAIPILLITVSVLTTVEGKVGTYSVAVITRAGSLISGGAVRNTQDTWSDRVREVEEASEALSESPLFGIGFANPYRSGGRFLNDRGTYVHNGYASVLLKMGLVGLIPFLLMIIVFIFRGFRLWKQVKNPFFQAIALGLTTGLVGLLIANISDPRFTGNAYWTPVFGVVIGINEVIYRLYVPNAPKKQFTSGGSILG
jgi:O-antigen ligase